MKDEIKEILNFLEDDNRERPFGISNHDLKILRDYIINLQEENEILNNIINELEKYLIEEIEDYDKHINSQYITDIAREQYEGEKVCFEDMLGKLQELKGNNNNENNK